jgi:dipeptidyl aminopeptidase/acylaminoacyl peptidase
MKKNLLLGCLLCVSLFATADKIEVRTFTHAGPYAVLKPYMTDSTNTNAQKFTDKDLLPSTLPLADLEHGKPFSAAVIPASAGYAMHLFGFDITNERFGAVTVNVSLKAPYQLYIDGQKAGTGEMKLAPATHKVVLACVTEPGKADSLKVSVDGKYCSISLADAPRNYSLSDVMDGMRYTGVNLSPSGKMAIVRYVNTLHGGKTSYFSRIVDMTTGKVLEETTEQMNWMPRSDRYYTVHKGTNGAQLLVMNPLTKESSVLAQNVPDGHFEMAPTEDYLVYTLYENGPVEDADIYQVLTPDDRQPGWRNRSYLSLFDLKTGTMRRLTYGYRSVMLSDIAHDGSKLLFSIMDSRLTKRPFELFSTFSMDVRTGRVDTLLNKQEFVSGAAFSPDGRQLLVTGSPEAFNKVGMKVRPGQTPSMIETELYLYNISDGKVTPLTRDFDPNVTMSAWNARDNRIYLLAENRDYVSLYCLNPKTGRIAAMKAPEDVLNTFSLAQNAPYMAYYGQSASNSNRLYRCDTRNYKASCVEDLSAIILKGVDMGECKDWNFVTSRGDTIYGRYYLPPHFDPAKKYPMVVNYYGGCSPTSRELETRYPQHAYAAQGYVVYVLQPSGATGFGQEFSARHVNTFGDYVADDIIEGTQKFCQEHPFVNAKKIGCIGASYGGFMTDYLCTKTDLFAAAISHAGISNQASYWGFGYWGYSYSEISAANSYPWNNPKLYTDHSPLFHADKVHTPLLFLHGSVDTNVPIAESTQMFTALKLLGRETAFVVVEGQNHHILDYGKRVKWQNTIFAWFAKWLKDEPEWWDSLYPNKQL